MSLGKQCAPGGGWASSQWVQWLQWPSLASGNATLYAWPAAITWLLYIIPSGNASFITHLAAGSPTLPPQVLRWQLQARAAGD